MLINGRSASTIDNYGRAIAQISSFYNELPQNLDEEQITAYLVHCRDENKRSKTYFKHTVYGLRNLFKLLDFELPVQLPEIKKEKKLPVVLNKSECRRLFKTPKLLKHRVVLTLTYACGLRSREIVRLKLGDIDLERKQIHIRESKYYKDRYVTLSDYMAKGLRFYIDAAKPKEWLFEGNSPNGGMSVRGLQWIIRQTVKQADIKKSVTMHTLRHSFATHAIENGQNLLLLKEEMGHGRIETTLMYLHIARVPGDGKFQSPFDTLYESKI